MHIPIRYDTILTHPGSAHKDDLLACAVLLGSCPAPIVRREPTAADLADSAICVVDVGHEHEPERNNFDHHHLPADHVPTCSLSLVLQRLGLYEDARQFCEWLEPTEWFDCRGAVNTAKWLGVDRDIVGKLNSPIDVSLLRRFAQADRLEAGDPLWEMLKLIGDDLLEYVRGQRARLDAIAQSAEVWALESGGVPFRILFLPRTEPLPDDPSAGLGHYIEAQGWQDQIVGVVAPDRRGGGYGLSRYNDNLKLDYTRIAEEPDVHFAHKNGFVAKTTAAAADRLKDLVGKSFVG